MLCYGKTGSSYAAVRTHQLTVVNSGCLIGLSGTVYGNVLTISLESVYSQHWMSIDRNRSGCPDDLRGTAGGGRWNRSLGLRSNVAHSSHFCRFGLFMQLGRVRR